MISNVENEKHKWNLGSLKISPKENCGAAESQVKLMQAVRGLKPNLVSWSKRCIQIAVIKSFRCYKSRLNFMLCCASRSSHIWFYCWHSVVFSGLSQVIFVQHGTNRKKRFMEETLGNLENFIYNPRKQQNPARDRFTIAEIYGMFTFGILLRLTTCCAGAEWKKITQKSSLLVESKGDIIRQ